MNGIGWISEAGEFAKKPLLGKPSRAYVEEALLEAVQTLIEGRAELDGKRVDSALVVREDAPGLTAVTLAGLAEAAARCV